MQQQTGLHWIFGMRLTVVWLSCDYNILDVFRESYNLTFRSRIKSRLPFAGIIRRLQYFTRFQDKG